MNIVALMKKLYIRVYCLFHPIKKQVIFSSFNGCQYSDNPRAVSEKLHELYPDYRIVWRLENYKGDYGTIPDYVHIVSNRIEYMKEFYKSFAAIDNCEYYRTFKRKKQLFIQTWHGDRPFKKILLDARENGAGPKIMDDEVVDIAMAESTYGEGIYRSAFGYRGEIMKAGSPRNDVLFNQNLDKNSIKKKLNIDEDCKVLIFAPTFRDGKKKQDVFVDVQKVLAILQEKGEKWVCLCRAHVGSSFEAVEAANVVDVSKYPDMADLLAICDFLISDYSTCACDFTLINKPVIMATFDEENYRANCREMYVTPKEAGFIVAGSQEELDFIVRDTTIEQYKESCRKVNEYFGVYEKLGNASEAICHKINELYEERFYG